MPSSAMHEPVAEVVLHTGFHAKKISGAKGNARARFRTKQSDGVVVALEQEGQDCRVKHDAKGGVFVKPGGFVAQNNGEQKNAAEQQTKLEFPESLKDARRDQDDKDRAEGAASGDRKIKGRQERGCGLALDQFTVANHANREERETENANFNQDVRRRLCGGGQDKQSRKKSERIEGVKDAAAVPVLVAEADDEGQQIHAK